MGNILSVVVSTVADMRLEDKLLPWRNPSIGWFCIWLPAFIAYMYLLMGHINAKPLIGSIEILNEGAMKSLFYLNSGKRASNSIEVIASHSVWSEGPLWIQDESSSLSYLIFSDTFLNKIYRWEEGKGFFTVGKTIHLHSSGCKSDAAHCAKMYEPGSNGLLRVHPRLLPKGASGTAIDLVAAQHGERAISLLRENGTRSFIATHYKGKRFNSPNDLAYTPEGHLYFTDPPYGIMDNQTRQIVPALQELSFSGVYMISAGDLQEAIESGQPTPNVRLLHEGLSRPNGLAFSPDFGKLYVSNSDPARPVIEVFDVSSSGALLNQKTFYDASSFFSCAAGKLGVNDSDSDSDSSSSSSSSSSDSGSVCDAAGDEAVGVPDGLKLDINGHVLASGPGGVLVLSPQGELLGRLLLPVKVSNLAFGADGRLYVTASDKVVRLRLRMKSAPRGEQAKR